MIGWMIVLAVVFGWWWVGRQVCKWTVKKLGHCYEMSGGEGFFFPLVWPMVFIICVTEADHSILDRFKIDGE